jgi:hypothetical protein
VQIATKLTEHPFGLENKKLSKGNDAVAYNLDGRCELILDVFIVLGYLFFERVDGCYSFFDTFELLHYILVDGFTSHVPLNLFIIIVDELHISERSLIYL